MNITKSISWILPLLLGTVLGALLFYTIEIWGVGLESLVQAFAILTALSVIFAFMAWAFFRHTLEKVKTQYGVQISELTSSLGQNAELIGDPTFRRDKLWPAVPAIARVVGGWFAASMSLALGVTLVANLTLMATLAVQYLQVDRLTSQNRLLETQNQLSESTRRAALIQELSYILNEIDEELDGLGQGDEQPSLLPVRLSRRLEGRINALSRSLRPYQFLDDDGTLTARPLSPERGQLIVSLLESGIELSEIWRVGNFLDAELEDAELSNADLEGAILVRSSFQRASLRDANLTGSQLHYADFTDANLAGATLQNAQLSGSTFNGALLPSPSSLDGANLLSAKLQGARVMSPEWLKELEQSSAIHEIEIDRWQLVSAPKIYRGGIAAKWMLVRRQENG